MAQRAVEAYGFGEIAARPHTRIGWASAVIVAELAQLAGERARSRRVPGRRGAEEPATNRVLRDCYALLGLISFFVVGEDELRAYVSTAL